MYILFSCRWKINGNGQRVQENGKPVLQFVAIKRKDNGQWAIPGVKIHHSNFPKPYKALYRTSLREFR